MNRFQRKLRFDIGANLKLQDQLMRLGNSEDERNKLEIADVSSRQFRHERSLICDLAVRGGYSEPIPVLAIDFGIAAPYTGASRTKSTLRANCFLNSVD